MAKMVMSSGPNGKDTVIVATREELSAPSEVQLAAPEPAPGLVLPDGSINWGCPCLGGMATGPCGTQFRDAFSCFHYSEVEPKGSDCYEKFSVMQECMSHYPELYGKDDDDLGLPADSTPRDLAADDSTPHGHAAKESTPRDLSAAESTPRDLAAKESTPRDLAAKESTPRDLSAAESTPRDKAAGDAAPTKEDK